MIYLQSVGGLVILLLGRDILVRGTVVLVPPIIFPTPSLNQDIVVMIAASLLFVAFCWNGTLVAWQGAILVILLVTFLIHSYFSERDDGQDYKEHGEEFDGVGVFPQSTLVLFGFIGVGLIGLLFGSHILIDGAVGIARAWGVSETVIGLTLVALGTSIPELATTIVTAMRIHVGNIVGSNMFNILGVMGITSLIIPLPIPAQTLHFDLWIMIAAALVVLPFAFRQIPIGRSIGLLFLAAYNAFVFIQYFGVSGFPVKTTHLSP